MRPISLSPKLDSIRGSVWIFGSLFSGRSKSRKSSSMPMLGPWSSRPKLPSSLEAISDDPKCWDFAEKLLVSITSTIWIVQALKDLIVFSRNMLLNKCNQYCTQSVAFVITNFVLTNTFRKSEKTIINGEIFLSSYIVH